MNGAREYAKLFTVGQYGKLYITAGSHARGKTFHIYILPEGVTAKPNGPNAPLNVDAVEVYGIVSGQPGWTETYGWLHEGKWQDDFAQLVKEKEAEIAARNLKIELERAKMEVAEKNKIQKLLDAY